MKRPRQARLGVRLRWIVPSVLLAGLLAGQLAREPFAPAARARSQETASPHADAPPLEGGTPAAVAEPDLAERPWLAGPKWLDDLQPPFLERAVPLAPSLHLEGIEPQAWEDHYQEYATAEPPLGTFESYRTPVAGPRASVDASTSAQAWRFTETLPAYEESSPPTPEVARPMSAPLPSSPPVAATISTSASRSIPVEPSPIVINQGPKEVAPTPLAETPSVAVQAPPVALPQAAPPMPTSAPRVDPIAATFQTREPASTEPAVKKKPEAKTTRQVLREVFTASPLPRSEARRPGPVAAKKDVPEKKADDLVKLPKLPELPADFGKSVETGVQRVVAQTQEPPGADSKVRPVSGAYCLDCGRRGGLPPHDIGPGGRCTSCGSRGCVPGRKPCYPCEANTPLGGFLCDLYDCICCPDPCYEPKWVPLTDAAFFAAGPRPVSQMRFGWDSVRNLVLPDRSEFFWARADGRGRGPAPVAPNLGEKRVRYEELTMYTETAVGGFSTFVEMPYRSMDPEYASHAAGFGDMALGTKSLLFDCELLLVTFQFKTYLPMGQAFKGLGTGHTTLEPSLLFALKLSCDTYIQGQLSEWIPLGGDPDYAGSVFHSHFSLNHVLCRLLPDVPLVGTMEVNTWSFQDGAYTDPINGSGQRSSGETYVSLGPGLRLFICDKVDFGVGSAFAMTHNHFAQTQTRFVFRYRF